MDDWISKRITYIKSLRKASEQQELLVMLYANPNRSPDEQKQLGVLIKAERAAERAAQARADADSLLNRRKDEARKARSHRLILQGLLLDFSGLDGMDRGAVLGGMLALREALSDPQKHDAFKRHGDELLAQKEEQAR